MMLESQAPTEFPLLKTKLFIPPPRAGLVSREPLIERLRRGVPGALTLVSAPAGYGKTTLLSSWAAESDRPVAWVSLDEGDNEFPRFIRYLIAAAEEAHGLEPGQGFPETLSLLEAAKLPPPDLVITTWANELVELPGDLVVVLDDYQFIQSRHVHDSLAMLLDPINPHLHLVIATRTDPPFPLARLRGLGQLLEIRTGDLEFSHEESVVFFNKVMALDISSKDVAVLEKRTEGWAAGLQLAALSLQRQSNPAEFFQEFGGSHKFVLEYLIEEVLSRQPEPVRHFLLHTAPLDRLREDLCAFVLRGWPSGAGENPAEAGSPLPGSVGMLQTLEKDNLFIVPLDSTGTWYRYHHLFADLLKARLQHTHPERLPILNSRASLWYEDRGLIEEAGRYALAASNLQRLAELIERHTLDVISRGNMTLLFRWMEWLPESMYRERPRLAVQNAWALTFTGRLEAAETRLEAVEAAIEREPLPENQEVAGEVTLTRALIHDLRGELESAVELAHQADRLLPAEMLTLRSLIPFIIGDGYFLLGDLEKAEQALRKIETIGQKTGNLWTTSVALSRLANLRKIQGRLQEAYEVYQTVLQLAAERGWRGVATLAASSVGLSDLLREWNQLDEAREMAAEAVERMERWLSPTDLVNGCVVLARIYQAQGETAAAQEALHRAQQIASQGKIFPITQAQLEACRVQMAVSREDRAFLLHRLEVLEEDDSLQEETPAKGLVAEIKAIANVRVCLAVEAWERAEDLLAHWIPAAEAGGRTNRSIELLTLNARVLEATANAEAAMGELKRALTLAQPHAYRRIFLDEGRPVMDLLRRMAGNRNAWFEPEESSLFDYAQELLQAWKDQGETPAPSEQPLIEPLSKRELEVLALVCQGLSNREIAERLFITQNTVKKHTHNIYGKLQVSNRTQAVILADELGLFPSR